MEEKHKGRKVHGLAGQRSGSRSFERGESLEGVACIGSEVHKQSIKEGERLVGGELWESLEATGERKEKES
jgi:hypothetical protein